MIKNILIPSSVSLLTAALLLSPNAAGQDANTVVDSMFGSTPGSTSGSMFKQAIFAKGYVTLSADAEITGNVFAGAATTIGANAKVKEGTINSGAATTLGAGVIVEAGDVISGAATTLGATSWVDGGVTSAAATTIGAGATINRQGIDKSYAESAGVPISPPPVGELELAQGNLYNLSPNFLTMTFSG
jgi:NDP-sugar pyrophosphorylase family protein